MAPIVFKSLTQLILGESNVFSLEVFAFFDTETIKSLFLSDCRIDKLKPLSKLNWPCLQ